MSTLSWRAAFESVSGVATAAARWWLAEFNAVCPLRLRELLNTDPRVVIQPDSGARFAEVVTGDGRTRLRFAIPFDETSRRLIAALLDKRRPRIGLALGPEAAFWRNFVMPVAARRNLQGILDQDLIHKTPFNRDDIVQEAIFDPAGPAAERLTVTHVIVRKDIVRTIAATVGWPADAIDFVEVRTNHGRSVAIGLRPPRTASGWRRLSFWKAGLASAGVLAATAVLIFYIRQGFELDAIADRLTRLKPQAAAAQANLKRRSQLERAISALITRKQAAGMTAALDAVTKVLPDDAFLQSVKITGSDEGGLEIALSGYAGNAANLVPLFEKSGAFSGAQLTAAIVPDPLEHKERFSLKAKLFRASLGSKQGGLR